MIEAKGIVTALDGEYAFVRMDDAGCGRCHEPGGCGGVNIGKMLCTTPQVFRVLNPDQTTIGQRVGVTIPDGVVRKSALLAYGIPLLMLLAGACFGTAMAGDIGALSGAGVGLVASFPLLRFVQVKSSASRQFQPYIASHPSGE